jgi:MFS family permease
MTVIFGKLADIYGRKPIVLLGIAVFVVSSILAGFAWSMTSMIVFRLLQGVGAGAIQPVNLTIVGDLYPAQERGKVQGWLASVWAISAVIGPMLGGLIITHLSWAWVFWINVPLGVAAAYGFIVHLKEDGAPTRHAIDIVGALLFTIAVSALMIALTDVSGVAPAVIYAAVGTPVVFCVLFVLQERRAQEPMISLALWGRRPIAVANGGALLSGMALMGITSFLPMYVQGVLQRSPAIAGLTLTMVMVGWPVGATLTAKALRRIKPRPIIIAGAALHLAGAVFFVILGPGSSPLLPGIGSFVLGLGMGLYSNSTLITIQSIVEPGQPGSATASTLFARNLGSTRRGAVRRGAQLRPGEYRRCARRHRHRIAGAAGRGAGHGRRQCRRAGAAPLAAPNLYRVAGDCRGDGRARDADAGSQARRRGADQAPRAFVGGPA